MDFSWDFSAVLQNYPALLKGVGMTALLWAIAFPVSMALGLALSLATGSRNRIAVGAGRCYVAVSYTHLTLPTIYSV